MEEVKIYGDRSNGVHDGELLLGPEVANDVETCRLCVKRCGLETPHWGLFENDLPQKLMAFAAVQIQKNDGLPSVICTNCRNLVYMSYNFKCQVERSDHDLRQALLIRQSTAHWPAVPIVKTVENMNALENMVPCLQKNINNSCMSVQNEHGENNDEQFIFDIANSCNVENEVCKKEVQIESNNSIETGNISESNNAITFEMNSTMSENDNREDALIAFEGQFEIKDDLIIKNDSEKIKFKENHESCNQSDDEKPLILRTKRHKCNYCIKSFASLSLLEKHIMIHKKHLEIVYTCYICDDHFISVDKVKSHAMISHGINMEKEKIIENSKMRRISGWVKKIDEDNYEQNTLTLEKTEEKKNSKFVCKFCCRQFTYHKPFMAHITTHPDYNDKLLNELNKSPVISEVYSETDIKTTSENVEAASEQINTDITSHTENLKVISYSINEDLSSQSENLEIASEENKCKDEQISYRDNTDESEVEEDDGGQREEDDMPAASIQCNQCGKLVATLRNLKRHLLTHSGLKHKCSICSKDFSRPDKLREHQQLKHKEELFGKSDSENESSDDNNVSTSRKKDKSNRPYKCSLCPKAFAQPQSLANHEERHKRIRDVQKRYLCEVCSKCFAQSGSLVAHMRTHTGIKPYVCNVCSRAFTKSTYLQLHLRTHSGEKPYICQYCSRAFARANTLARHITMHTGEAKYQCQICTKSFRRLTSLNEHTYTHTGQRPYACKICSKRYNNAGSLYAHTKKCKAMQAAANQTTYPVSLHPTDNSTLAQSDNNAASQLLIFTEKKIDEMITDETITTESPTCQFMITNVHGQKQMPSNMLESYAIQEPDVYNMNSKQFKTPYYGLYPNM